MDDRQLLRLYATTRSQEAFAQIVQRHVRWLHAMCARQLRDVHLAEDVTQAVFLLLSQKAARLPADTSLTGWLFRTAQLTSSNAMRMERRRQQREARAAAHVPPATTEPRERPMRHESELLHALDRALVRLRSSEREVLLLRFYREKPVDEIATDLSITIDATRKRVTRAIQALRQALAEQGVVVPATGAATTILAATGSAASQAMPIGLSSWVAAGAAPATVSARAASIAGSLARRKVVITALLAAAVILLISAGVVAYLLRPRPISAPFASAPASPPTPLPATTVLPATLPEARNENVLRLTGHTSWIPAAAISPDGRFAASRSLTQLIRWDLASGQAIGAPLPMTDQPFAVAAGDSGLVVAIDRRDIAVFDAADSPARRIGQAPGSRGVHWSLALAPDRTTIALGGIDGIIRLLNLTDGHEIRTLGERSAMVTAVAFSGDGSKLLAGHRNGMIEVFDVAGGTPLHTLSGHTSMIMDVRFSNDGGRAVSFARSITEPTTRTTADPFIRVWDIGSGNQLHAPAVPTPTVWAVTFTPDDGHIAAYEGGRLVVWSLETGEQISSRPLNSGMPPAGMAAVFSRDCRRLLFSGDKRNPNVLCVLDLGKELRMPG